jgi:hypothetical protein
MLAVYVVEHGEQQPLSSHRVELLLAQLADPEWGCDFDFADCPARLPGKNTMLRHAGDFLGDVNAASCR